MVLYVIYYLSASILQIIQRAVKINPELGYFEVLGPVCVGDFAPGTICGLHRLIELKGGVETADLIPYYLQVHCTAVLNRPIPLKSLELQAMSKTADLIQTVQTDLHPADYSLN